MSASNSMPQPRLVPSLDTIVKLTKQGMDGVNQLIIEQAKSHVELIPQIADHLIASGGKRLRPMLTLAASSLYHFEGPQAVTLAASVEFMHTATLLHDDVVDGSDMRRGRLAARMLWGNAASVLVGDFLLGQAFRLMVSTGSLEALRVLSDAAARIAEGEVLQLAQVKQFQAEPSICLAVADAKTATLFAAAVEVGPILAQAGQEEQARMQAYGHHLGMAFQLADDALDYDPERSKLGKRVGDDFRDGKMTLPVVMAYREGNAQEQAFWRSRLGKADATEQDLQTANDYITKHNTLARTRNMAAEHVDKAQEALQSAPKGRLNDKVCEALLEAAAFAQSRNI